jgi:hypothetical protein
LFWILGSLLIVVAFILLCVCGLTSHYFMQFCCLSLCMMMHCLLYT